MAASGGLRRPGNYRPGGTGTIHRSTAKRDGGVGPVPSPGVVGGSYPTCGGPHGGDPEGGRALLHFLSSFCFFPLPSLLSFCSLSRSRCCPTQTRRTSAPETSSPGSPTSVPRRSPPQGGPPADSSAGVAHGPACWRCGDPSHFRDQCPLMELGTVVRVSDLPQAAPDRAGAYWIPTDASDRGLGAVLSQVVEGEERPVLYISRKLSLRETKYSTVEKECLAIKWAVLTLRYYLLGRVFTLCSDHAPLQWLHRMKDTNAQITRWYLALQPFKFKVVHRPGVQMAVADFLSRNGGGVVARPDAAPA
ncbi:uncharacterized protein LOC127442632 [Myxocyprinus asiaticus]|uniref:uncharacterized protein LOC127442632 n=1 Tax=Myxocyprinus asiaticus TaxID=70543 RepID=UPI002221429B|nr:uncharacterized protein LOC127442632 [Myxocyprinus asiaticus]